MICLTRLMKLLAENSHRFSILGSTLLDFLLISTQIFLVASDQIIDFLLARCILTIPSSNSRSTVIEITGFLQTHHTVCYNVSVSTFLFQCVNCLKEKFQRTEAVTTGLVSSLRKRDALKLQLLVQAPPIISQQLNVIKTVKSSATESNELVLVIR